jgi:8-oxo-dGTP diphosphatase
MRKYSLGFIFNFSLSHVLLIHKNEPEWQRGKINGIGGKIEENELPVVCIVRETMEEAGLKTLEKDWTNYGQIINSDKSTSQLFYCTYKGSQSDAKTQEDEEIEWFPVDNLPKNIISNLSWLIPLALDKYFNHGVDTVKVVNV